MGEDDASWSLPEIGPSAERAAGKGKPAAGRGARYPLAEALLTRLFEERAASSGTVTAQTTAPFVVGPAVMRAPAPIITPPAPPSSAALDEGRARADELMEDLVDVMLVGDDEDGKAQVHLAFKDEVFGGLYVKLERDDAGLFAIFTARSELDRRAIEGHVGDLLARFRNKGMRIVGHRVEVSAG